LTITEDSMCRFMCHFRNAIGWTVSIFLYELIKNDLVLYYYLSSCEGRTSSKKLSLSIAS
jgi:hypothetical protein